LHFFSEQEQNVSYIKTNYSLYLPNLHVYKKRTIYSVVVFTGMSCHVMRKQSAASHSRRVHGVFYRRPLLCNVHTSCEPWSPSCSGPQMTPVCVRAGGGYVSRLFTELCGLTKTKGLQKKKKRSKKGHAEDRRSRQAGRVETGRIHDSNMQHRTSGK